MPHATPAREMNRLRGLFAVSLSIALLGGCGDERSATPPTSAGVDPGLAAATRAGEAGAWTRLRCGETDVAVDFASDPVRLLVGDEAFTLRPVRSASGAKYEAIDDPTTTLWNKGASTMLTLRGTRLPECQASAADASTPAASVRDALP